MPLVAAPDEGSHKCQHPPSPAGITTGQAQMHCLGKLPVKLAITLGWEKPALGLLYKPWKASGAGESQVAGCLQISLQKQSDSWVLQQILVPTGLLLNHTAAWAVSHKPGACSVVGARATCHLSMLCCASPAHEHPCRSRWPAPLPIG